MKYSYFRLKELTKTKNTPEQLAELLTMKAFEVESVEHLGQGLDKVVVGQILEILKHPNADKLQVAVVDIGKEKLTIVCGAPNISVGQKVPVALVGANLPASTVGGQGKFEIKEAEIRGVKSSGMLCAEDELGLGKDHSGILILDADAKIGASFAQEMWLEDAMLDIKVLPDRAHDALSHVGMAREICALEGRRFTPSDPRLSEVLGMAKKFDGVKIADQKLSSRYIGVVIENIRIAPSPVRYRLMLQKFGNNAISNIVDVTNVVMLETGQPMHAFDYDKLTLPVSVRAAKPGEKIKLLDGNIYELTAEDIVIADAKGAIALAGIMGGFESAVSDGTNMILLEAAQFEPVHVRRTRTRLGLKTDASDRFEKGLDASLAERGMAQAVGIVKMMGGQVVSVQDSYPAKSKPRPIFLAIEYVEKLLGVSVPEREIKKILENLGCKAVKKGKGMQVIVPSERLDLATQEDLIEDIGRIYGYEKIKPQAPMAPVQPAKPSEFGLFDQEVKHILTGAGFSEVLNYSFYSRRDAELAQLGSIKHLELENPMNPEQELVRMSLLPNLLKNVAHNLKFQKDLKIFESGRVFWAGEKTLPEEKKMLVGALALDIKDDKRAANFYEAKGIVHNLLESLGIDDFYFDGMDAVPEDTLVTFWHQGRTAQIRLEGTGTVLGYLGEVSPLVLTEFDIHRRLAVFELNLEKLLQVTSEEMEYKPIRKHPVVERDISLVVPGGVLVDDVLDCIQRHGGNLVIDADLFDIYDFADGSASYAFRVQLAAEDRTLEGREVDEVMDRIASGLEEEIKATIRK